MGRKTCLRCLPRRSQQVCLEIVMSQSRFDDLCLFCFCSSAVVTRAQSVLQQDREAEPGGEEELAVWCLRILHAFIFFISCKSGVGQILHAPSRFSVYLPDAMLRALRSKQCLQ